MVTMKQIANRAGVSISTVSLVLNNRDIGRVSPDVAERVRDIAAELGYLTNRLASGCAPAVPAPSDSSATKWPPRRLPAA